MSQMKRDLPHAIYAAAGAGDAAYERLRTLPETAARTLRVAGQAADEVRRRWRDRDVNGELAARVRARAEQGTATVLAKAASARERATVGYQELVARGQRVIGERLATEDRPEPGRVEVVVDPVRRESPEPADRADGRDDEPTTA